jgi:hypothetical protein
VNKGFTPFLHSFVTFIVVDAFAIAIEWQDDEGRFA